MRPVLFSNVLHVPHLNQNLLTCNHAFRIIINSNMISFIKDNLPCFYASVGEDRVTLLSGSTVVQSQVTSLHRYWIMSSVAPLLLPPLSWTPQVLEHQSVLDLKLPGVPAAASIPICPACTDGKQTRDSFPQSASCRLIP